MQAVQRLQEITWEAVSCPLCGAASEEEFLLLQPADHPHPYRLVRCRQCGLGYLNPRPDQQSIRQFYPDEYEWYQPPVRRQSWWKNCQQHLRRLVMSHCFGNPPALTSWWEKLLARLAAPWLRPTPDSQIGLPYQGEGRLLDFGCGSGWYLHKMRELGWQVTGMDFNASVARQVEERFGIRVHVGTLPHPEIQPASFDVITMGAVLEHVHRPHAVIEAAARALRPGGYLMVSVPNFASWGLRVFGPDWWGLQLPHHLLHFTPLTLRRLLEQHGLQVRQLHALGQAGWMRRSLATLRARQQATGRGAWTTMGKLRIVSSLLTRWSVWKGEGDFLQAFAYRPKFSPPSRKIVRHERTMDRPGASEGHRRGASLAPRLGLDHSKSNA
jgi:2-polyprenyl-3-methyl-5-hydroxy-6-metoxy-1,4-benzoquinol methylase